MAFTGQDGIFVWQKVAKALAGARPGDSQPFREFKTYFATQVGNPSLQFVPYTATQATTNNGTSLVGGACTLYAWYAKARRTTGTTASFQAIHDAADNTATTTTVDTFKVNAVGQSATILHSAGLVLATDAVISAATAVGGATESAAADATDGFIIVGA